MNQEMETKNEFYEIIEKVKEFNYLDIFLWLQVVAAHPSNQKYGARLDFLNSLLLSVQSTDFKGKVFIQKDCERLFDYIANNYSSLFIGVEDFKPFDQLKLIPYFYKGRRYYFYYSIYESPFEELENFQKLYLNNLSDNDNTELKALESYFIVSLEFQSALLEKIIQIEESKKRVEKIYIPTQNYFNEIVNYFEISKDTLAKLENMINLNIGDFNSIQSKLVNLILSYDLYETFKFKTSDGKMFFLWPGKHIDILHTLALKIYKNSKSISDVIKKNSYEQLCKICRRFFTIRGTLVGLYIRKSSDNVLNDFDFAGITDGGKIILFRLLHNDPNNSTEKQIAKISSNVQEIIKNMKEDILIGLRYADNPKKIPAIPTSEAEIFTIFVVPKLALEPISIKWPESLNHENNFIIIQNDLQRIFEKLDSPLSFIKFLRDDATLKETSLIYNTDFLDRFICYVDNGNTFSKSGKNYKFILFEPHSWSNYYFEMLYEKNKDSFYELLDKYFPDYFNKIKKRDDGIYAICESSTLSAAYAIKFNNGLIIMNLPPDGYFCIGDEIKLSEFIALFCAYYFLKYEKYLVYFFNDFGISLDELYGISVMPISYIRRNNINYLLPLVSKINDNNPIEIKSGRIQRTMNLRTAIVFDCSNLHLIFEKADNQGEREVLFKLLISLLRLLKPNIHPLDIEKRVKKFINKRIPIGPRRFSLDEIPTNNPKAERYGNYEKPSDSDFAKVQKIIAEHIASTGIKPGEYDGIKALAILESSFDFIYNIIEEELRQFNDGIVLHAFEQLDFVEFERISLITQAGIDSSKYVEFDVASRFAKEYNELTADSIAVKYLCTIIIKFAPCGVKPLNRESWDDLFALAYELINISWAIDFIKYDLRKHKINITEMYEIRHDIQDYSFDINNFSKSESQNKITASIEQYNKRKEKKDEKIIENSSYLDELDMAFFKENNFKVMDMICVLIALGRYMGNSLPFLVNECNKKCLIDFLEKQIAKNCPSSEDLSKIIDFISLEKTSFNNYKIIPTQLFRDKKRLNLCPVYHNEGTYIFGNQMCLESAKLWSSFVHHGDFPYKLNETSPIEICISAHRRRLDKELEKEAEKMVKAELGAENCEANISNFKRLSGNFYKNPECGEIDILAVNKKTRVIFLLDAKNRRRSVTPYDVKCDIDEFLRGKKSYLNKIIKKEKFIKDNWKEILKHFMVIDCDGWSLKKAFIVKQNYQIAYHYKKAIDFIEIKDLNAYLKSKS